MKEWTDDELDETISYFFRRWRRHLESGDPAVVAEIIAEWTRRFARERGDD